MKKQNKKSIPNSIRIGGITIPIHRDDTMDVMGEDVMTFGYYDVVGGDITIDDQLSDEIAYSIYIHEVIEAINDLYSIGLKHKQIEALERALCEMGTRFDQ